MIFESYKRINGVDLGYWAEAEIIDGVKIPMQAAEVKLYQLLAEGCRIRLARKGDDPVGILIYHQIFDSIIAIRMLYIVPEERKS
jgi:hypothetical protein